jgi:hypothetical protein
MNDVFPDNADDEKREQERLKDTLAFFAGVGATVEGFLTATESELDDPAKQQERETHRKIAKELEAILGGEFSELRKEMRLYLRQRSPDPIDEVGYAD